MYRIPVINQNDRFLDLNEQPLVNGKVEILDPVSTDFLTIWSYTDDEYTVMTNPVILDIEGRVPQTIFCDRIVYVRVYAFKGYDEHNQPIYEFIRDFYAGENENSETREYVVGIEALKDLDPSVNSSVNVLGYFNAYDCPMRQYVWDAACTQDADNGYIVASDTSATGRWILVFSGEYLPSSYYGVYPGHIANINALLSYIEYVGTTLTKTAPGVWFVPGDYDVSTNLQTTKRVLLDAGTTFSCQYFYCGNLRVIGEPQSAICDFDFYDPEQEAHSSWFRTMAGYLTCGAKKFIFDERDNFVNHTLQNANYTLQNKIIEGQTRLPVTYNGDNCRITFNNCAINAERIFNSTDKLGFAYTDIHDHWWNSPASIDFVNNVSARTVSLNTLVMDNFTNITAYVNAMAANGATVLDLAGRDISSIAVPSTVTELRNVIAGTIACNRTGADIVLRNCKANNINVSCRYLTTYDCDLNFSIEPNTSAIWFYRSRINAQTQWTSKTNQIIAENSYIGFNLKLVTDNEANHGYISFTDCEFQQNCAYELKFVIMKRCITNNNSIKIYPHKADDKYYIGSVTFENNTFNNNNPIEFTKIDELNGWAQDNVYECIASWTITGNNFMGNTEGLRCRYWHHRTGSNYNKTFIAGSGNSITYTGNIGNCPAEDSKGMTISGNQTYTTKAVTVGETTFTLYKYSSAYKRVMPTIVYDWAQGYFFRSIAGNDTLIKYYSWVNSPYDSLTYDVFIQPTWYLYHIEEDNPTSNGDFFRMGITTLNDYLRIVQRGDGDHNKGIIGKVI